MINYRKKNKAAAFTLVELIMVVMFIGVFATIAVPRMSFSALFKKKADTAAMKIVTDLRRTRSLAITNAANYPQGFELQFKAVPLPVFSTYEIVNSKTGEVIDSHTTDSDVDVSFSGGSWMFQFEPLGNLKIGSGINLDVEADGHTFSIEIISATGMIEWSED